MMLEKKIGFIIGEKIKLSDKYFSLKNFEKKTERKKDNDDTCTNSHIKVPSFTFEKADFKKKYKKHK